MLRLIKHALFGSIPKNARSDNIYLSQFEGTTAIPIIFLIFYFGLHPAPILNSFKEKAEEDAPELPEYEQVLEEALIIDSLPKDSLMNDSLPKDGVAKYGSVMDSLEEHDEH